MLQFIYLYYYYICVLGDEFAGGSSPLQRPWRHTEAINDITLRWRTNSNHIATAYDTSCSRGALFRRSCWCVRLQASLPKISPCSKVYLQKSLLRI